MTRLPNPPVVKQGLSVSYFRQLIQYLRESRIIAGQGMKVSRTPNGTVLDCTAKGGGGTYVAAAKSLHPFAVRWFAKPTQANPDAGEWQVYIPTGSLDVIYGSSVAQHRAYYAMPTNEVATDGNGENIYRWFKIPDPTNANADVTTSDGMAVKQWTVYALIKPWARFLVSTDPEANDEVAWIEPIASISLAEWTEQVDGGTVNKSSHSATSLHSGAITKTWDVTSPFAIEYILSDETSKSSGYTARVINQTKMLGRLQVNNVTPVDVTNATEVWIEIDHSGEDFSLEVKTSVESEESNDDVTVYKIYDLSNGVVVEDYRGAIPELPFYTNSAT